MTAIAIIASDTDEAQTALGALTRNYNNVPMDKADIIVALGGDGFMLETLRNMVDAPTPIFGMNLGTIGFLMNEYRIDGLIERLEAADALTLNPLHMRARTANGEQVEALAFNEVALLRETRQAAKIRVHVDDLVRLDELVCDGVLVATPAGSSAYNLSAHGPILPLGTSTLALTPISAFRPRRWRGAILPDSSRIRLEILNAEKRPVSAVADQFEVREVKDVFVEIDRGTGLTLLFDPEHSLDERILMEQFTQ